MSLGRAIVLATLIVMMAPGVSQESESTPCIDKPIRWQRFAGPVALGEVSVIVQEGTRSIGPIDVAALVEQQSDDRILPECGLVIERTFGNLKWLVGECVGSSELTVLRIQPGAKNSLSVWFNIGLMGGSCTIGSAEDLGEDGERVWSELRSLTQSELDQLVSDVRDAENL